MSTTPHDTEARLLDALAAAGQPFDGTICYGGVARYGRKQSCWLTAYQLTSGHVCASFGDWRQGSTHEFKSWLNGEGQPVSGFDAEAAQSELDQRHKEAEAKQARRSAQAAKLAELVMEHAPAEGESEYLKRKRIGAHGVHFGADEYGSFIAVPMIDVATGTLKSVQRIYNDGNKLFLPGTPLKSNALTHLIGAGFTTLESNVLWLTEGYSTGATVFEITGQPVLITFNSDNLPKVAKAVRERWPDTTLHIAADNDQWKAGQPVDIDKPDGPKKANVGLAAAEKAAKVGGVKTFAPDFTNLIDEAECRGTGEGPTDFNDLFCIAGAEVTRRQLEKPRSPWARESAPVDSETQAAVSAIPLADRFTVIEKSEPDKAPGVWYTPPVDEHGRQPGDAWVCAPLLVTAETRDAEHDHHGSLLEFKDRHGHPQQWAAPHEMLVRAAATRRGFVRRV